MGGGAAGLGGAAAAHVLTALCDRLGSETWLKGPHGPQFFNITLYSAILYASIGGAAARRAAGALAGAAGPALGIGLPMLLLTWLPVVGAPTDEARRGIWFFLVSSFYILGIWGAIASIGAVAARTKRWRGALAAIAGSLAAYGVLAAILRLAPNWSKTPWNPTALIPSPVNLLDGVLSGALLCLALVLDEKIRRNP